MRRPSSALRRSTVAITSSVSSQATSTSGPSSAQLTSTRSSAARTSQWAKVCVASSAQPTQPLLLPSRTSATRVWLRHTPASSLGAKAGSWPCSVIHCNLARTGVSSRGRSSDSLHDW